MSTTGTLVRNPGIVTVSIGTGTTILRGQLVTIDTGTHLAKAAVAAGDRIVGVALSDSDPDLLCVWIGCKGGYTISMVPKAGDTFFVGSPAYQDQATFSQVTVTSTASKAIGWVVDPKVDSLGNLEIAFYIDLEA
jgi:hypothetical protein